MERKMNRNMKLRCTPPAPDSGSLKSGAGGPAGKLKAGLAEISPRTIRQALGMGPFATGCGNRFANTIAE